MDRLLPKGEIDKSERVEDNAFHPPGFLINLNQESRNPLVPEGFESGSQEASPLFKEFGLSLFLPSCFPN